MHHRATLYDSTYRSLGKNTSLNTWKKCCSKTLHRNEGSEEKRKARISTVFKVTKSSGVSLHSHRGFLSSLQVTLHHWGQNHPADSLLWSPIRQHVPLHWATANLKQTYAGNFQPIIWYIWFSSFFLQAQLVRRLAAKILICFKVVANAFHSLLFYMQALCQCAGFQTISCGGVGHLSCDCPSLESLAAEGRCWREKGTCGFQE